MVFCLAKAYRPHSGSHASIVEQLVHDKSVPKSAETIDEDLPNLQALLEDKTPSYVLVRLDGENKGWLFVNYVPDDATVRDKVCLVALQPDIHNCL